MLQCPSLTTKAFASLESFLLPPILPGLEARELHFQNHLSMVFPVRFSQWGVLVRDLEAEVMQTGVGIVREVGWGGRG